MLVIGALVYFTTGMALALGLAALMGSALTPYVRAGAEAEGKASAPIFGDRRWRNIILIVGLLTGQPIWTLGAIALVANYSGVHRLILALRKE